MQYIPKVLQEHLKVRRVDNENNRLLCFRYEKKSAMITTTQSNECDTILSIIL